MGPSRNTSLLLLELGAGHQGPNKPVTEEGCVDIRPLTAANDVAVDAAAPVG